VRASRTTTLDELKVALAALEKRMASANVDHSLGRLLVEMVESDLATSPGTPTPNALALVTDVLPRYLAALEPARAPRPNPPAAVTVTLVRWPYT
jgi:hypothetical protein